MRLRSSLAALSILAAPALLPAGAAFAATYYVAPLAAVLTCASDGSRACPYASITTAFGTNKIVGGDTVLLMDGTHASSRIGGAFSSMVTIQSENGSNARMIGVLFEATAKNITMRNLKAWRDDSDPAIGGCVICSYSGASYLTFENLEVRSREDSINYLTWTQDRWSVAAAAGFTLNGSNFIIQNNTITGVQVGILVSGSNELVQNNVIDGFIEDGIKGDASDSTFRGNLVKNVVATNFGLHSDGFQSYAANGLLSGIVLESNSFIAWTNDPASPLKGVFQGIGMFDGWYDNLTIRNNLVVTDHYHGISVYGTRGATITNNTVVSLSGTPNTYPWIMVTAKKDGSLSQNVLVANNLAMAFSVSADSVNNIVLVNNSVILDPAQVFTDLKSFNYRPTAASGFVDTASVPDAPAKDILGAARPYGAGPDRGAYEIGTSSGTTSGTTTTGSTGGSTGTTAGGTTAGGTTTGGTDGTTTGGTTTGSTGGTTTGGTTTGGTTTGGSTGGTTTTPPPTWTPKFLKPPKKK